MSHFFDYLAILIILVLAFIGYRRGFLEELSRLTSLIISSLIALKFYEPLSTWLRLRTSLNETILSLITFLGIFFIVLIGLRLLMASLQIFMLSKGIRSSNKLLGFVFGSLKGFLVVMVMLWAVDIAPNPKYFDNFKKRSYVYRHFSGYPQRITASFGIEGAMSEGESWVKEKINPKKEPAE